MPATSIAQRKMFAIAEHEPRKLYKRNRRVGNLPHKSLHDFAATPERGLPQRAHFPSGRRG
jgi:hypothetical protein